MLDESYLTDSDDSELTNSFHNDIFNELFKNIEHDPDPSSFFISEISDFEKLTNEQPLFFVIDIYERYCPEQEILLRVWQGIGYKERFVHLRGFWCEGPQIMIGDPCFIHSEWSLGSDEYNNAYSNSLMTIIDNVKGNIVIIPNILIMSTEFSKAAQCERSAYLTNISPYGVSTMDEFRGNASHEIFQQMLKGEIQEKEIIPTAQKLIIQNQQEIKLMGQQVENVRKTLAPYFQQVQQTAKLVQAAKQKKIELKEELFIDFDKFTDVITPINYADSLISEVKNDEEPIWDFDIGIRGRIDAVMKEKGKYFPLELKSGASKKGFPKDYHVTQLSSYVFMMKHKYKENSCSGGVLCYLEDQKSFIIKPTHQNYMHFINSRNCLSSYIYHNRVPPIRISHIPACKDCPGIDICDFIEDTDKDQRFIDFYNKWETLLGNKMKKQKFELSRIWSMPPNERIKRKLTISNLSSLIIDQDYAIFLSTNIENIELAQKFKGTYLLITRNGYPPIIGRGMINYTIDDQIYVKIIESNMNQEENSIFLDPWPFTDSLYEMRSNLMTFLTSKLPIPTKWRKILLSDEIIPSFNADIKEIPIDIPNIDKQQKNILIKSISMNDFILIQALPFSKRLSTLISIIQIFDLMGQTILLCLTDADKMKQIMMGLQSLSINYYPAGFSANRIQMEVLTSSFFKSDSSNPVDLNSNSNNQNETDENDDDEKEKEEKSNSKQFKSRQCDIVICLLNNCNDEFILTKSFDVCIIDDASKVSFSYSIAPVSRSRKFILIGDNFQYKKTDQIDLFSFVLEKYPDFAFPLSLQNKMNVKTVEICNKLIYKNTQILNEFPLIDPYQCFNSLDVSFFDLINDPQKQFLIKIFQNNTNPINFVSIDYEQLKDFEIITQINQKVKSQKELNSKIDSKDDQKETQEIDQNTKENPSKTEKLLKNDDSKDEIKITKEELITNENDKKDDLSTKIEKEDVHVTIEIENSKTELIRNEIEINKSTENIENKEEEKDNNFTTMKYLSDDDFSSDIPTSMNYLSDDDSYSNEDDINIGNLLNYNEEEAFIASFIGVFLSLNNFTKFNKVAITSLYKDQILLIRKMLCKEIEIYQPYFSSLCPNSSDISKRIDIQLLEHLSQEYDIIILGLVDNDLSTVNWEYFSTILTSFKAKLIIIGNSQIISSSSYFMNELFSLIGKENIIHLDSSLTN